MTKRKAILPVLAAALLIAFAGPAIAKKQTSDQVSAAQKQAKKKAKAKSGENCFYIAPPFMRNPRFMNRGFFKKKCPGQEQ